MDNDNQPEVENSKEKTARYLADHVPALLKKAAIKLENHLQHDPKNCELWLQLGNIYRGLGNLQPASQAFRHAAELNHKTDLSRYLITLCDHLPEKLIYPNTPFVPAPFLRHFDILSNTELDRAFRVLIKQAVQFKAARIGTNQVRKTTRHSVFIEGSEFKTLRESFRERIKPCIAQAFDTFGITPPEKQRYELQMTSHADGDFYRRHVDVGPVYAHVLSYVYYFNKTPKAFSGGELQLFDTDTQSNTSGINMTSIEPLHNSLIVFPSNYYHQVCTVKLPNADRTWGRQTINGWLVDEERQIAINNEKNNSLF